MTTLEMALTILKMSPVPLSAYEIYEIAKKKYHYSGTRYEIRDVLYARRKMDVVYRTKPHYDYQYKELYIAGNQNLFNSEIIEVSNENYPLFYVKVDVQGFKCTGYINVAHSKYNIKSSMLKDLLPALMEMYLNDNTPQMKKFIMELELLLSK